MPKKTSSSRRGPLSAHVARSSNRREFFTQSTVAVGSTVALGGSAAVAAGETILAGGVGAIPACHASGSDTLRIGLIGCGARGRGAAIEAIQASLPGSVGAAVGRVELVAMADVFANHLQTAYRAINGRHRDHVNVGGRRFVGIDGWKGVLAADVDMVLLATPPAFRPLHFAAAVDAGKHVFMESPLATDMPGVRRVMATGKIAEEKGLAVSVGLQRRHEARLRECVDRLHDGVIGKLLEARTVCSSALLRRLPCNQSSDRLEEQLRRWQDHDWASGGFTDERHLHCLDAIHWVTGQTPVAAKVVESAASDCAGDAGGEEFGEVTEKLTEAKSTRAIELDQENGFRIVTELHAGRGSDRGKGELVIGAKGVCDLTRSIIRDHRGKVIWQSEAKEIAGKGWQRQFNELIAGLRNGHTMRNHSLGVACTTTAILERTALQTDRNVDVRDLMVCDQSYAHPQCTL
ncbi:Gfo/Idh/MocA family protein [Rhodopirellula sallentina]|uniref:Oxidoreductase domain-containing protein n=1 Tax=Rhodopirellula sallentina SM41 TaxID=1263870 RepID=M5UKN1_9BACT|nr:Gfo/Idh/MocA family oxidoreductase [Rhodopirellula sallentina]EMI56573.1 oxidoreductase domain-containing protein [Rhodopirellula sallentina SM41]